MGGSSAYPRTRAQPIEQQTEPASLEPRMARNEHALVLPERRIHCPQLHATCDRSDPQDRQLRSPGTPDGLGWTAPGSRGGSPPRREWADGLPDMESLREPARGPAFQAADTHRGQEILRIEPRLGPLRGEGTHDDVDFAGRHRQLSGTYMPGVVRSPSYFGISYSQIR